MRAVRTTQKYQALILLLVFNIMSVAGIMEAFGTVKFSENSNAKINGERNQGVVVQNTNLNLFSIDCVLNLIQNSNAKINAEASKLECTKSPNIVVTGKGNNATLKENSNSKFEGDKNQWDASFNSNLKVLGSGSTHKLLHNSNGKVEGDRMNVVAEKNVNLKVLGDDANVIVKGTQNHEIKPAKIEQKEDLVNNMLDISPSSNGGGGGGLMSAIGSFWNSRPKGNNVKFTVDYVDKAIIDHSNYHVGMFTFTVKDGPPTSYEVKLDESSVDPGSLITRIVSPTEVIISATKEGVKQNLKLQGPCIQQKVASEKTFSIEILQSNM